MTRNRHLALAALLVCQAALATPALAAGHTAGVHAFFEQERTRTDGHPAGLALPSHGGSTAITGPMKKSEADRRFLFELARTDGNPAPYSAQGDAAPAVAAREAANVPM